MRSRLAKVLIGCGIGCGGIIVLVVIAIISFSIWIQGRGELLEPRALLFPDATGYAEWTLRLEDEGTERFARALFDRMHALQRRSNEALPGPLGSLMSQMQAQNNERAIRELFPLVGVWAMRPPAAAGGGERHVFSVSVERFGNRIVAADWLLGWAVPDEQTVRHAGERVYAPNGPDGVSYFLHGAEVVIAGDLDSARAAAERLSGGSRPEPSPLAPLLDAAGERPLRLAVLNDTGMARTLWPGLTSLESAPLEVALWVHVTSLSGGGGFDGAGFDLDLDLRLDRQPTPAEAAVLADGLRSWLADTGLEGSVDERIDGRSIRLAVVVDDALAALDALVDDDRAQSR